MMGLAALETGGSTDGFKIRGPFFLVSNSLEFCGVIIGRIWGTVTVTVPWIPVWDLHLRIH